MLPACGSPELCVWGWGKGACVEPGAAHGMDDEAGVKEQQAEPTAYCATRPPACRLDGSPAAVPESLAESLSGGNKENLAWCDGLVGGGELVERGSSNRRAAADPCPLARGAPLASSSSREAPGDGAERPRPAFDAQRGGGGGGEGGGGAVQCRSERGWCILIDDDALACIGAASSGIAPSSKRSGAVESGVAHTGKDSKRVKQASSPGCQRVAAGTNAAERSKAGPGAFSKVPKPQHKPQKRCRDGGVRPEQVASKAQTETDSDDDFKSDKPRRAKVAVSVAMSVAGAAGLADTRGTGSNSSRSRSKGSSKSASARKSSF